MNDIWQLIAECGVERHPDFIQKLASDLSALDKIEDFGKSKASFGSVADRIMVERFRNACSKKHDWTPKELAAALRGASTVASLLEEREQTQMVWTGPQTEFVASRHTSQVLMEVIKTAKSNLFMTSFVAYKIDKIVKALNDAVTEGVKIGILLEMSTKDGGKVDIDSLDIFKKNVPAVEIYTWRLDSNSDTDWSGTVHAKCAVADGKTAFITSANLTAAALERNMELGVLFRGGRIPDKLSRHLEALVATGVIVPV